MLSTHDSKIEKKDVILTTPISLEGTTSESDYKAPSILQLIFSLFKNVRPGTDLTHFQLPPLFNMPKSQLQYTGEIVYCVNKDMLSKCTTGETPIDRMIAFVAWNLSTVRTPVFGIVPYNPILGETHHASRGSLNVLLEQVSHHPPVLAMHATDETSGIELIWSQHIVPKFYGTHVEGMVHGKRRLKLLQRGEIYETHAPIVQYRFLPKPGALWVGNVKLKCQETNNIEAQLSFKNGFLGFGESNCTVKGKIIESSSKRILFEIYGQWNKIVYVKDVVDGKAKVLYNAKETISSLPTPILKDPQGLWQSESAAVWGEVSKAIINKEWDKASEAKKAVEEKEREIAKQRKLLGQIWSPKHFNVRNSSAEFGNWDISPKQNTVPNAPIVFPI